jgi:beta-1,4-mannosyl-glycoprotein beta-1,4-N-acetylglucosaminyltransferase
MIIDSFPFFNELDLLESRLDYLYEHVDYFILVESNVTFNGVEKPLYYLENQLRYKKYQSKIIYYPYIFDNSKHNFDFNIKVDRMDYSTPQWFLENAQRQHITNFAIKFDNNDYIMISDLDEIPNREKIKFAIDHLPHSDCAVFVQDFFHYNLYSKFTHEWYGTAFSKISKLKQYGAQWFRNSRYDNNLFLPIKNGGWHLSYFFDIEKIIEKIESFAHQEFNREFYKDPNRIKLMIDNKKELFGRDRFSMIECTLDHFPETFLTSFKKFI